MTPTRSKPTELAITIAALGNNYHRDGWFCADEIRGKLALLGFDVKTQQVAAWLGRMSRDDAPWVERQRSPWNELEYRVTPFGLNDIANRLCIDLPRRAARP